MSFWLGSRLLKILILFAWGCQLRKFRLALWFQCVCVFFSFFFLSFPFLLPLSIVHHDG